MPVKEVVKSMSEPEAEAAPEPRRNTDARVDELGKLLEEEAAGGWKAKQKKIEALKKELCAEVMDGPTKPQIEVPIEGEDFVMVVDGVGKTRGIYETVEVDNPAKPGEKMKVHGLQLIHQMLGDTMFYRAASMTIKNIEAYLTIDQREKVLGSDDAKSRTMKSIGRRAPS